MSPAKKHMRNSAAQIVEEKDSLLRLKGLRLDERFEIISRIALGSYAEIHLAANLAPRAGEPEAVVIKALNLSLQGALEPDLERTLIENIALEAQTMGSFNHENIVRLFAYGRALDHDKRQFYYLVLEYVPGGSLAQFCRAQPLSLEQTVDFTGQICSALSYAHAQGKGVLHRDVKPSNIMLSLNRRTAKLLDFGTARLLNAGGSITRVGTDLYSAPEHYSLSDVTRDELTPATDVYALAKTVYYMVSGASPAPFKQRQITVLPWHVANGPWGARVLRVLQKATSEIPSARHQSVREFDDDLRAALDLTAHSPRKGSESTPVNVRQQSRIVIEIPPRPSRDYGMITTSCWRLSARCATYLMTFIAQSSKRGWDFVSPWLRHRLTLIGRVCRHRWERLSRPTAKQVARLAVVVALTVLLIAMTSIVRWWHLRHLSNAKEQRGAKTVTISQVIASTDINIRSGRHNRAQRIGLVEWGSLVRILSYSKDGKWCEIEVIQHGRDKKDSSSADRGWVSRRYLTPD